MMKQAVHDEKKHGHLTIFADHKHFHYDQGQCLGLVARLTYYEDDKKQSVMMLMDLIKCNPALPDKSAQKTAEHIKHFLEDMGLWKLKNRGVVKITADYAISGYLGPSLKALGWENIENSISICKSHTEQLKLKRTESELNELIQNDDLEGRYKNICLKNFLLKRRFFNFRPFTDIFI